MPLDFILTNAGKAAIVAANNTSTNPVTISEIAIGSASWTPTASATALNTEIKRFSAIGGGTVADDTIHVTGSDSSADVYTVKEVGLYLSTGVLLAVYSQSTAIITKGAATVALLAADLVLTGLPAGSITVGDTTFEYPQASETVKGVAEIATDLEAQTGTDDTRMLTPKKLQAVTATTTRKGVVELATDAEARAGTDTVRALTPSNLGALQNQIKAWVSFNGVGTIVINNSYNVSSISDLGVGKYKVNFATSIGNTNFAALGSAVATASAADTLISFEAITNDGWVSFSINDPTGNDLRDSSGVFIAVIGY